MCHVEADVEIGDCDLFLVFCFGVRTNDSSGECRRVFGLILQHCCEELSVLAVERPVGRRCGLILGRV